MTKVPEPVRRYAQKSDEQTGQEPLEVLLVEDSPQFARLFVEALREKNQHVSVTVVSDGVEAVRLLAGDERYTTLPHPDIVFLDIELPGMNGREVLSLVRNRLKLTELPIHMLARSDDEKEILDCYRLGATTYIVKPGNFTGYDAVIRCIEDFRRLGVSDIGPTLVEPDQAVKLLVVEDSTQHVRILKELLSETPQRTFVCEVASTRAKAMKSIAEGEFDCILLDLALPDSDGLDTLRSVHSAAASTPIVVLSVTSEPQLGLPIVRAGAQDALVKWEFDSRLLERVVLHAMERKRLELEVCKKATELRGSEARLRRIIESNSDGMLVVNQRGVVQFLNPTAEGLLGNNKKQLIGKLCDLPLGAPNSPSQLEIERASGEPLLLDVRTTAIQWHGSSASLVTLRDITQYTRLKHRLAHNASYDQLTGLPNRQSFINRLSDVFERWSRNPSKYYAVFLVDLDRFQLINDSFGHPVGDSVLAIVARRLTSVLRPGDMVARVGGDEFTVLSEDVQRPAVVEVIATRILECLKEPLPIADQNVFPSASIGLALFSHEHQSGEDVLRDADTAMFRAKSKGGGCCCIFEQTMHEIVVARIALESSLKQAVERQEFCVFYQPIVSLIDGTVHRMEALVRWNHPERGVLRPQAFLETAEETGLIVPMGEQVLRAVCEQLKDWGVGEGTLTVPNISINLSGTQLLNDGFWRHTQTCIQEFGLDPRHLSFEVTENTFAENMSELDFILAKLKSLNCALLLDDFGTGSSSLAHLARFPIDVLKIDRSFITGIADSRSHKAIVSATIGMAHGLGLEIVGEGVETESDAEVLASLGCTFAQGYYYSHPVDSQAARDFCGDKTFTVPNKQIQS